MSRAMCLDMAEQDAIDLSVKLKIQLSTSEPLPSGGCRVVLSRSDDVATLRRHAKNKVMGANQQRSGLYSRFATTPYR